MPHQLAMAQCVYLSCWTDG